MKGNSAFFYHLLFFCLGSHTIKSEQHCMKFKSNDNSNNSISDNHPDNSNINNLDKTDTLLEHNNSSNSSKKQYTTFFYIILFILSLTSLYLVTTLAIKVTSPSSSISLMIPHTNAHVSTPPSSSPSFNEQEVASASAQFQSLRSLRSHFHSATTTTNNNNNNNDNDAEHEFNKDVDGFRGLKHQSMQLLARHLGKPGTPLPTLVQWMGTPDEVVPSCFPPNPEPSLAEAGLGEESMDGGHVGGVDVFAGPSRVAFMPGPVIPAPTQVDQAKEEEKEADVCLVYYWRGRHDYVWFLVGDGVVKRYEWFLAGE